MTENNNLPTGDRSAGGNPNTTPHRRKPPQKQWGKALAIIGVILALAISAAFYGIHLASDLFGLNQEDRQAEVIIPSGTSSQEVGRLLEQAGIISHPYVFNFYAGIQKASIAFQAGTYVFNDNMAYDQIIIALNSGNSRKDVVKITFYEGMSQREIAKLLEEEGVCSADEFHEYLANTQFDYPFIQRMPEKDERFRPMEGYLFPDTYEFFKGEKVASVVNKFLSRFESMMTEDLYARMKEMNMTLDETITLASVIQEECSDAKEMSAVAGVFHNRLDNPATYPKLQSDVTIFYVNKDIKPFLNMIDQPLFDKYNTYVCTGLPIGPISSPGIETIKATLYPEENDYFFFLTDSKGKFYYAETYEEHLQNLRTAERVGGDSHGIGTQD